MNGQNLVRNSSFELNNECPRDYTHPGDELKIVDWYAPTRSLPDYFNSCSKFSVSVPSNLMGYNFAKDGNAYIGMILSVSPDKNSKNKKKRTEREYIQTKLLHPLLKDSLYKISFNYCVANHSTFTVSHLGICLSEIPPSGKIILNCKPQISKTPFLPDSIKGEWIEICDTLRAVGNEIYLTIGNFFNDSEIKYYQPDYSDLRKTVQTFMKINGFAYYYIDMVEVKPVAIKNTSQKFK